jgi:hypothetical protein
MGLSHDARRLRCRLAFLLLSPSHFACVLARLRAMPLHAKAALLGRVLLCSLPRSSRRSAPTAITAAAALSSSSTSTSSSPT